MSGIVGIVNGDGAPLDAELLQRMTDALAFRGPDAQQVWHQGHVGFGHTMLRTTIEAQHETQPYSLDGQVWITADARIDGWADLIRKLQAKGRDIPRNVTDPELILHAYHAWGQDCVQHLLGDFAFAIWDTNQRQLFCARDHFGVKPFYYAHLAGNLIISNTLNCVRWHPAVSDELNEQAIGDFLLFDLNQDLSATFFSDIRRLPPAHYLTCSGGVLRVQRYWQLPAAVTLEYRQADEYIERFKELLETAVSDRLRTHNIGLEMSGGLDSTTIAAWAKKLLPKQFSSFKLDAYCVVYDHIIPDQERRFSGQAADFLDLPIHYMTGDDYQPYQGWETPRMRHPEPVNNPNLAIAMDFLQQIGQNHRVSLTGYDGDTIIQESPKGFFRHLFRERHIWRLFCAIGQYIHLEKALPPVGFRTWLSRWHGKRLPHSYPHWLNAGFAHRLDLAARWQQVQAKAQNVHPVRPLAYRILTSSRWVSLFEGYDPGTTKINLEVRHPMIDLRLVDFLMATPPVPWCLRKHLLRVSAQGLLPDTVRLRPKSPLAGDVLAGQLKRMPPEKPYPLAPKMEQYVAKEAIMLPESKQDSHTLWMNFRVTSLSRWLQGYKSDVS